MSIVSSLFKKQMPGKGASIILDCAAYKEAIESKKVQLVDVRTSKEYSGGYIKDAVNIDFFQKKEFTEYFEGLERSQPVYLYCRSGQRSQKAATRLLSMGFEQIIDLKGGILQWNKEFN